MPPASVISKPANARTGLTGHARRQDLVAILSGTCGSRDAPVLIALQKRAGRDRERTAEDRTTINTKPPNTQSGLMHASQTGINKCTGPAHQQFSRTEVTQ